jgi:hypothetical protein
VPLTGTSMNRLEREWAAAIMVRICQILGDQWAYVSPQDLAKSFDDTADINPIARTARNPLIPLPDFVDLVNQGFAEFYRPGFHESPPIGFTQQGLRALRRWVGKSCPKCGMFSPCLWFTNDPKMFGWTVYYEYSPREGKKPLWPEMINDQDFNSQNVWQKCKEIFKCAKHGEYGLLDDGPPFFYEPDTYVLGPNGEKIFRI